MSIVNEKIKQFRALRNLSQENVASELGMSHVSYRKYENGKTELTVTRLYQLAKIFNVSVLELLGETKPEPNYKDCPNCARLEKVIDNQSSYIKMLEQKCNGNELEKRKAS